MKLTHLQKTKVQDHYNEKIKAMKKLWQQRVRNNIEREAIASPDLLGSRFLKLNTFGCPQPDMAKHWKMSCLASGVSGDKSSLYTVRMSSNRCLQRRRREQRVTNKKFTDGHKDGDTPQGMNV
jgi:hypothetical protein